MEANAITRNWWPADSFFILCFASAAEQSSQDITCAVFGKASLKLQLHAHRLTWHLVRLNASTSTMAVRTIKMDIEKGKGMWVTCGSIPVKKSFTFTLHSIWGIFQSEASEDKNPNFKKS